MSGPDTATKRALTRLTQMGALAVISVFLYMATRAVPENGGAIGTIASVGYLLLAGTLTGELVDMFGLPQLTGYIIAGVVAGPYVVSLIDERSVRDLTEVNALALALIALEGGAHLRMATLRRGLKSLAWATILQSFLVMVGMALVFMALRRYIPFARGLHPLALAGTGLLWGTLSITRSPSATLAILTQTRAKGPIMTNTISFVMTSDIVVVVLLATAIVVARPMIDPSESFSPAELTHLGHDLLGSIALGTTLGIILATYTRFVGTQLLVVFLGLGFGMSALLNYLRFDTLLAFMVAGFVVQNLSNQGEKFIHAIEKTGSIVYVIFFATAGAGLDVPLLRELWKIALALVGARLAVTWIAGRFSGALAKDLPQVKAWGWAGLVSQAGLALGIAPVIARSFPDLGAGFGALAIATLTMNQIIGPVLFKVALDRAGETSDAPRPTLTSLPMEA